MTRFQAPKNFDGEVSDISFREGLELHVIK